VTSREKVDIRKPFAQQCFFNITRIIPISDSHLSAGINRRVVYAESTWHAGGETWFEAAEEAAIAESSQA
jgi:hypothetical protein